jgi:hypothetical protein
MTPYLTLEALPDNIALVVRVLSLVPLVVCIFSLALSFFLLLGQFSSRSQLPALFAPSPTLPVVVLTIAALPKWSPLCIGDRTREPSVSALADTISATSSQAAAITRHPGTPVGFGAPAANPVGHRAGCKNVPAVPVCCT